MIIGLDIDNVIADLDKTYLEYFLQEDKNKRNAGIINHDARHITEGMFDWSEEEIDAFLSDKMDEIGEKLTPIAGAKTYIDKLKNDNHRIFLLTHRKNKYWKDPVTITKRWLKDHEIYYDKLIFTQSSDKSPECFENKIDLMFDDSVSNCHKMVDSGIPCYLFKTRYNENYKKNLKIIKNWPDLYQTVYEKSHKLKVILDTDTYNECDDQFALAYLLKSQDRFDIQAITVAPFLNIGSKDTIAEGSQKSYDEICKICNWLNFDTTNKVFKGAGNYLRDGRTDNEAVDKIIEIALQNDKTYILAIGAITNVAMAIIKEPKIINRLKIIWLGGNSLLLNDNKEFNFIQDIEAVRTVFKSGVDLTVIPAKGVASNLMTSVYELEHYLKGKSELNDYLCRIFYQDGYHKPYERRVIWDISVIAYLINEFWFDVEEINCPEINEDTSYNIATQNHKITMVNYIKASKVYHDLFTKLAAE